MFNEGLVKKFKVNRNLTERELRYQLRQNERLDVDPKDEFSLIKFNDTYIESVDKYFKFKGFLTTTIGSGLIVTLVFFTALSVLLVKQFSAGDYEGYDFGVGLIFSAGGTLILAAGVFGLAIWGMRKECFCFTHYPIRLNRKNKKVYVFRLNGSILEADWDDLFFTIHKTGGGSNMAPVCDIRGHVLSSNGWTVVETFAFSVNLVSQEGLKRHWEFLRRYMEEGPSARGVYRTDGGRLGCFGIDEEIESFRTGLKILLLNLNGLFFFQMILFPFFFLCDCGRFIAMHTSKIPVWPQWVEEACQIDPNDPYELNGRNHPFDSRLQWKRISRT